MISVIIPVYNDWKRLEKALDSVARQTHKDVEVIVVDDGSEESRQWKVDSCVRLIRQEHTGAPAARNRGLAEAKGEYVIFWDADVVALPQMLEKLKNTLDKRHQASYVYCNFQLSIINFQKKIPAKIFNFQDLKKNNFIHTTSLIRRKDVARWDESLKRFQDWDLWLMMAENGKTGVWVDEYLFTVLAGGKISTWLPSFAYKMPFCWLPFIRNQVKKYQKARQIILQKHNILSTPSS